MTAVTLHRTIDRIAALYEREVALRERARAIEIHPQRREAAAELYRRADGLARARRALRDRCQIFA